MTDPRPSFLLLAIERVGEVTGLEPFILIGALLRDEVAGGVKGEPTERLREMLSRRLAELC